MKNASQKKRPAGPAMRYADIRHSVQTADVLLFQGTSAISKFIRWGSQSPYSHAGVTLWWHKRLMVVQSAGRGVEVLPASVAVDKYDGQVDWWQPTAAVRRALDEKAVIEAAFDELGKPYAVWPLIALVARMFRSKERGNPDLKSSNDLFCSQLISRCFRKAGVDLVPEKADHDTSPGDIARSQRFTFMGVLHKHPLGVPAATLPTREEQAPGDSAKRRAAG